MARRVPGHHSAKIRQSPRAFKRGCRLHYRLPQSRFGPQRCCPYGRYTRHRGAVVLEPFVTVPDAALMHRTVRVSRASCGRARGLSRGHRRRMPLRLAVLPQASSGRSSHVRGALPEPESKHLPCPNKPDTQQQQVAGLGRENGWPVHLGKRQGRSWDGLPGRASAGTGWPRLSPS